MKEIIYYKKENGEIPVKEFFSELKRKNSNLLTKIYGKIKILGMGLTGNDDVKFIKDKIYELRVKSGTDISRVFYFLYLDEKIVLLHGIIKKDNKLNNKDIEKAVKYKNDYIKKICNI